MRSWLSSRAVVASAVVLAVTGLLVGFFVDRLVSEAQFRRASNRLELLMTLRKGALESYFDTVRAELTFWSINETLRSQLLNLREAWAEIPGNPTERLQRAYIDENPLPLHRRGELVAVEDGSAYAEAHRRIHDLARAFVVERGYYDFFLLDPDGNVIYSVEKESDFADNLRREPLRGSGLARVHQRALDAAKEARVVFSDFERYAPSSGDPALFAGVPVLGVDGAVLGVMAVQVPTQQIQDIMQFTEGMGSSGETYLVGADQLMRSDSRFSETSTTLAVVVESETAKRALSGETGIALTDDYRGIRVLSAYGRFTLDDFSWAVLAEIDRDEIANSITSTRLTIPLVGLVFYALSLLTLWIIGPMGIELGDLQGLDPGEPPPA
jgi:methyl-accepting chemotaxis protein